MNTDNDAMDLSSCDTDGVPYATCRYQFRRGALKGQYCNRPVYTGGNFCSSCSQRKGVVDRTQTQPENRSNQLHVVVHDLEQNLFKDINHNFIIRSDGLSFTVIGQLVSNEVVSLNDAMKKIARDMGLTCHE